MSDGNDDAKEGMRFALARIIGEVYDGYADPIDTPNNWSRALTTVDEVLNALSWPTNEMISKGALEFAEDHASDHSGAFDVFCVMIQSIKDGK